MKENAVEKKSSPHYRVLTPEEFDHLKARVREIYPNFTEEEVESRARFYDRMREGY
ncbi:MAG: hypothetical protein FWH44_05695 [Methanomassiliicoccaceae archaeon]|nr:hypothetical protein [Methanomassiliicoccaceae archaeon]